MKHRPFAATIILETEQLVQDAANLLTRQGYEIDSDYEFFYGSKYELLGLQTANPKVAHIILAFS